MERDASTAATARLLHCYFSRQSDERSFARFAFLTILLLCFAVSGLNIWINTINGALFTALQQKDVHAFFSALLTLASALLLLIGIILSRVVLQRLFELRWRRWLTMRAMKRWTRDGTFYRMQIGTKGAAIDNPDQRVAEDIKSLVATTLRLAIGGFQALVSFFSFAALLWHYSGSLTLPVWYDWNTGHFSTYITIPGYLVWIAIIYQFAATWIAFRISRPLKVLENRQQRHEADFRHGLIKLREDAEAIALLHGGEREYAYAFARFGAIYRNGVELLKINARYLSFEVLSNQLTSYLPYFVAGPRYFLGAITLGEFVQINNAFGHVSGDLAWFIGMRPSLAEWRATLERLLAFEVATQQSYTPECAADELVWAANTEDAFAFPEGIILETPQGAPLMRIGATLNGEAVTLRAGEHVLMTGASGIGKSIFVKALAGFWPFGQGMIKVPRKSLLILPQQPYFPFAASLREALWYPHLPASDEATRVREKQLLTTFDLGGFIPLLERGTPQDWRKILSLGEQQHASLVRAALLQPHWLILDETVSGLATATQDRVLGALARACPATTFILIGHTPLHQAIAFRRHFSFTQQETLSSIGATSMRENQCDAMDLHALS